MRRAARLGLLVCLPFTVSRDARADPARWPAVGPTARVGTAVGFSHLGDETVTTLGGQVALGYRVGLVAVEAEYENLAMLEYMDEVGGNSDRGDLERIGVNARLFLPPMGPRHADPDSVLRLFIDGGVGRQRGRWTTGDRFARSDVSTGGGWLLDHRMRPRRAGLPLDSIGWHFGWRLSASRTGGDDVVFRSTCVKCRPPMPDADVDLSLVVNCALSASW